MHIKLFKMDYREAVSRVINTLKLNNRDEHVSRRYVLSLLKSVSQTLISQKWLDRTILYESNLFTNITCFEFEPIEVVSCPHIEFRRCKTLMKSVKPLPKLVFSRLGGSLRDINSLDGLFKFTVVDKAQYLRNIKRAHSIKGEVYIYLDNDMHLYIPDQEIYTLDLNVLTTAPDEAEDCSGCKIENCKSKWETEFICPQKLEDVVFTQVLQILGMSRQIINDQNPNNVQGS